MMNIDETYMREQLLAYMTLDERQFWEQIILDARTMDGEIPLIHFIVAAITQLRREQ